MNYLKNVDLVSEHLLCVELGRPTEKMIEMWQLLIDRSSTRLRYKRADDRDDCKSQAMEDLLRYWRSFNPERGTNYFAWATSVCKNGFAKGWKSLGHREDEPTWISISVLQEGGFLL